MKVGSSCSKTQWEKFFDYWVAVNKKNKMKWMIQETFDLPQRIRRFGEPTNPEPIPEQKPLKHLFG